MADTMPVEASPGINNPAPKPGGKINTHNGDDKEKKSDDAEVLSKALKRFGIALDGSSDNRKNFISDVEFSCSDDQWDPQVKRARGNHRPALTFNRLNGVIKQIIGDYRQNKLAIKVLPASGDASEDTAEILAGLIRNIEQQSNADMAYANALECSARGGFGYFRIITRYTGDDEFDQDLVIQPIHNALTVYMDPSAKLLTREDANWCFIRETMPLEQFKEQYPDASSKGFDSIDETYKTDWYAGEEVSVAEYFEKATYSTRLAAFSNGMVMEITDDKEIEALAQIGITLNKERQAQRTKIIWRKITGAEILEEKEYKIRYIPVIPVIGEEVNVEGKTLTRSVIFYAKDAQRTYNYFKSVATETVSLAPRTQWLVTPEHIENLTDQWDNLNTNPTPYAVYNHQSDQPPPQRLNPPEVPVGEITMAGDAGTDLQYTTGVFDANLGQRSNETSGVAIGERQHQGATATMLFVDNLKKAIEHCGKVLMDWIPEIYDAERVVRVLDLEGNPSTETINQQKYDPMTGVTEILNSITVGKYDVVIDTGPNFASRRREAQDAMLKIAQVWPQLMNIAPDLVISNIDAPGMEAIAARAKRTLPPQITTDPDSPEGQQLAQQAAQQQAQQEQTKNQMLQMHMQTEQGKQQAEQSKSQATVVKAQAEVVKAHADVIEALHGKEPAAMSGQAQPAAPVQQPAVAAQQPIAVQQAAQPTAPQVHMHLNAEHAMGDVAHSLHGMAAHSAANTDNIAKMVGVIAHAMESQGQHTAAQTHMLHQVMQHTADSHQAMANALHAHNVIAAAPRRAVRDPHTQEMIGSEVVLPHPQQ